jgi:hypothetical protein
MKTIKINRYYNKKGNSYATKDEHHCLTEVCKKLKISNNPKMDVNFSKNIMLYLSVEKQVNEQFDCNKREIIFKIIGI